MLFVFSSSPSSFSVVIGVPFFAIGNFTRCRELTYPSQHMGVQDFRYLSSLLLYVPGMKLPELFLRQLHTHTDNTNTFRATSDKTYLKNPVRAALFSRRIEINVNVRKRQQHVVRTEHDFPKHPGEKTASRNGLASCLYGDASTRNPAPSVARRMFVITAVILLP